MRVCVDIHTQYEANMVVVADRSKMDPEGTRYLVVDYINYRLNKKGYEWSNCPRLIVPPLKLHKMMRDKGDEFEERYKIHFQELVDQLHITQDTAYPMFKAVVEELFTGGINWGRIVALFAFGGSLGTRCIEMGMTRLVDSIVDWITLYAKQNLQKWIDQHGGWQGFVDFYSKGPNSQNDSPWDGARVIGYGVLGAIGAVALGALLTQRT